MRTVVWNELTTEKQTEILQRPVQMSAESLESRVRAIGEAIETEGDAALLRFTAQFDGTELTEVLLPQSAFDAAEQNLSDEFKAALKNAYDNIYQFHKAQQTPPITVETQKGVVCEVVTRPIEKVGLYIPGGTAPLFSTVLMLAIPAQIAGCQRIVLASPPTIADEIIYAAKLCGIDTIYTMGGAQAIFALGLGTEQVEKVDKIFGPGNSYVTEAKRQVSQRVNGAAIDMPAGPSEVLVIADDSADPDFVASDLLSQAEHGADSQVILVTTSQEMAERVNAALDYWLARLSRKDVATESLRHSTTIIVDDLTEAVHVSNQYAPEHLILQTQAPRDLLPSIQHAGSVFVGQYSPESMGDYASGTNHVLPTYGYAKTVSSLGLADFSKRMTIQEISEEGLKALGPIVSLLAEKELLDAHKLAVDLRLEKVKERA
ncbi:histidinol dehydrogenase [Wohlfahrtiimonas chitiniclastica]|uniref:histidinol dehydrogenase n=1 Tax=Wohlfahrtiimonas chitiniclastica TaxID=400946 RepID=UPI001BCDE774|nr:histidinol dehydrogenase [Wohlfahrtiimonas chitiniclastica]MBS7817664.1 histidinol dehydrogenase [Wohlfahrtiimonas chitiniclastica]MBS7823498.1 histidinol dehydrogenase [Wohlfahrtiimonas chitiniclastica]MBS7831312.1 histidinol dehydrogenase [Wohlfahrtiimonas chitiniclastica]MBS7833279.1 histidinol dehydrogenase [Wohlfahrtiimonas chitiniclastica]